MSRDQNAEQNHNTETGNNSFESVEQVKYLGTNLTNQNFIRKKKTKSKLKSEYACYHSVHNLLSSSFLPKIIKTKINRTIIFPVVLFGCETLYPKLREERRLRVFENRILRRIFGSKREEVTDGVEKTT
jgi:hypothetical protein